MEIFKRLLKRRLFLSFTHELFYVQKVQVMEECIYVEYSHLLNDHVAGGRVTDKQGILTFDGCVELTHDSSIFILRHCIDDCHIKIEKYKKEKVEIKSKRMRIFQEQQLGIEQGMVVLDFAELVINMDYTALDLMLQFTEQKIDTKMNQLKSQLRKYESILAVMEDSNKLTDHQLDILCKHYLVTNDMLDLY